MFGITYFYLNFVPTPKGTPLYFLYSSLDRVTSLREGKLWIKNTTDVREWTLIKKTCYLMGKSNSGGTCQQNDSMAKEYCGLTEEHGDVIRTEQPLTLVEYHDEKENIISCVVCNFWWSCFSLSQPLFFLQLWANNRAYWAL